MGWWGNAKINTIRATAKIHYTFPVTFDMGPTLYLGRNGVVASAPIMFKKWRVVAVGFYVAESGVSSEDPIVYFGLATSDLGSGEDYWGAIKMDSDVGKNFVVGDMVLYDPLKFLQNPQPCENMGGHWVAISTYFEKWQTLGAVITASRPDDHTLGVIPIVCLEVKK